MDGAYFVRGMLCRIASCLLFIVAMGVKRCSSSSCFFLFVVAEFGDEQLAKIAARVVSKLIFSAKQGNTIAQTDNTSDFLRGTRIQSKPMTSVETQNRL